VRYLITATATGERDGPDGHATRSACVMLRKALDPTAAEARRQAWPMAWRPSTAAPVVLAVLVVTWVLPGRTLAGLPRQRSAERRTRA
jgi:hypothetical protein